MELETIFWARLKALRTQTASHDGRISTLEGRSIPSSQTSAERWGQLKTWVEAAPRIIGLLRLALQAWPLLVLAAATAWTLLLPGLRWLLRALSFGLAWLVGLVGA